jgi:hypothetical protein
MTRILTFDGDRGSQRFTLLRTALLNGGDGKGDRTVALIRKEARLLDLLDGISEPTGTQDDRVLLNHGPQRLEVAQDDFELLQTYAEKTPWTPRVARQAVDLFDWLSATERRDS